MSISHLIQLAPPPKSPIETGSQKQWEAVQKRLGFSIPGDYKAFISTYGTGCFNNFILPYNPFASNDEVNTFMVLDAHHQAARRTQAETNLDWSIVKPFKLYPSPDGLLPWGTVIPFGQSFFWQISGPAERWETIFYDLRAGEYEVWKLPFSAFLEKLLSGKIESVLLPSGYPPTIHDIHYTLY